MTHLLFRVYVTNSAGDSLHGVVPTTNQVVQVPMRIRTPVMN